MTHRFHLSRLSCRCQSKLRLPQIFIIDSVSCRLPRRGQPRTTAPAKQRPPQRHCPTSTPQTLFQAFQEHQRHLRRITPPWSLSTHRILTFTRVTTITTDGDEVTM